MKIRLKDNTEYEITQANEQLRANNTWRLEFDIIGNYTSEEIYNKLISQMSLQIILIDDLQNEKIFDEYNRIISISTTFNEEDLNESITVLVFGKEEI